MENGLIMREAGFMDMDRRKYIEQFDLIYEMPSKMWQDGTPLGNGSMGALAYEPFHLEWSINKNDVWDYRHPEFKRHSMDRIREIARNDLDYAAEMSKEDIFGVDLYPAPKTCGQLRIRFGKDCIYTPGHRVSKRLNLYDGILTTSMDKHLSHPRVSSYICADQNIMVVSVRNVSAMTAFHNHVDLSRTPDSMMPDSIKGADGDLIWLDQHFDDGFRYVMMARIVPTGGVTYKELFKTTVQEKWWSVIEPSKEIHSRIDGQYAVAPVSGDFDLYLTIVTSLESEDPFAEARNRLEEAVHKGTEELYEAHTRWWAEFWSKCYVGLDDPLLEQLWYLSLYNLATVLPGTPVGALCGLWFGPMDTPSQMLPWHGYYTNDYNAQLPIMPVFRANHPELANGAFQTLSNMLPNAMKNAQDLYDLPGAYFPLATDPTGEELSSGPYRFCQNSGPYWSIFLWWHYLYTKDVQYLDEVSYPIMREVATFFINYLQWHEEEKLYHLEFSQNQELMYIKYSDPVDTMTMLKYTLNAVFEASKVLGVDIDLADKCQHVLQHFPEYAKNGLEISPLRGLRPNHITHGRTLGGLFPCGEFDPEVHPEWYDSCKFELDKAELWSRNYAANAGYTVRGFTGNAYHIGLPACRMEFKDLAWDLMESLLKTGVKPNSLITHNAALLSSSKLSEENIKNIPDIEIFHDLDPDPLKAVEILNGRLMEQTTEDPDCKDSIFPALEGPAVYLLLMGEMLLQSQNGILRLFPALPDDKNAAFVDLRCEGPILVSSQRLDGEVKFIQIKALADVSWKVRNPWKGQVLLKSSLKTESDQLLAGKYIEINLKTGEQIVLAESAVYLAGDQMITPRMSEEAQARMTRFDDGMVVWLGKPKASEYYASLEKARG